MNTDILGRDAGTWREYVMSSSLQTFEQRFILLPWLSCSRARQLKPQTPVGLQDMRLGWHHLCAPLCRDELRLSAPCTYGRGQLTQAWVWAGGEMWWMGSFYIFLSVRLSRGFELFPYQKWDELLWTAHFSCRHMYVPPFFCLELILWHIPTREKSHSMLCQWAQQPQAMLGSLHIQSDSLSISTLSIYQWFLCVLKLLSGKLPCTALEIATFFSPLSLLCTLIFQISHAHLLKNWSVLSMRKKNIYSP